MVALIEGSSITYQVGVLAFSGYTIRSDLADLGLIFAYFGAKGLILFLLFLKSLIFFKNCRKNDNILEEIQMISKKNNILHQKCLGYLLKTQFLLQTDVCE